MSVVLPHQRTFVGSIRRVFVTLAVDEVGNRITGGESNDDGCLVMFYNLVSAVKIVQRCTSMIMYNGTGKE
jgi:hypothetical protein